MVRNVTPIDSGRVLLKIVTLVMLVASVTTAHAALAPTDTLVLVNGDPITVSDFDDIVMRSHRKFQDPEQGVGLAGRLLEKRIDDYLILQDALSAGYDEDPNFVAQLAETERQYAIQVYVKDNVVLPAAADSDSVRAYFERFYWRIQIRRISVRTREEAADLMARIQDGEDMDALAREFSLDTKKLHGGLYNLLYWADVENRIRDQVRGLEIGDFSGIFPYNDAFSFIRVEQLLPLDEEAFSRFEPEIIPYIHGLARQRVWDAWVTEQEAIVNVGEDMAALAEIIADSAVVTTGEFLKEQPAIVIGIPDGPGITGTELRRAISHEAMQSAMAPFNRHLAAARQDEKRELVLGYLAESLGYLENPEVEALVQRDWEKALIENYLNDSVAAKIRFNRQEFQEFYDANLDQFRGPEEVRLDILILADRANAEEASRRLQEGADFGYIYKQYNPDREIAPGKSNYIKITELSPPFQDELETMTAGQSSNVVEMPMGWMVFKLDARRPGPVPPLDAVEMEIRRVMYARKFHEILDEHLALLRENSEIKRWPERFAEYLQPVGEGR